MRIDARLVELGLASTRERAQTLIAADAVTVNGTVCRKKSFSVESGDTVMVTASIKYVGRGGVKLEKALRVFSIDVAGKTVLDIGASTGGFTDCALRSGAARAVCVDVGHGQLAQVLRDDPRVTNLEGVHVRDLASVWSGRADLICVDVSFLSLTNVLPYLIPFADESTDLAVLVKPQFEVRHKKSVIRDEKTHRDVLRRIAVFAESIGFGTVAADFSPVCGTEGNIEYLFHLRRGVPCAVTDFSETVHTAHCRLRRKGDTGNEETEVAVGSEPREGS